nr:MAG TPA: hypothetical protein [Caudoviricetes sp.]
MMNKLKKELMKDLQGSGLHHKLAQLRLKV